MELLETQHPDRKRLIEASDRHKRELEKEVQAISDNTQKVVTNALIIGGVLAGTFLLVSQLGSSGGRRKKRTKAKIQFQSTPPVAETHQDEETPGVLSTVGSQLANAATVMLLDLAKEALVDYLKSRKQKDADTQ